MKLPKMIQRTFQRVSKEKQKRISDLNTSAIQDTKKNITELTQKKNEILQNIGLKIKAIKKRLDSLHVGLERSLKHDHEGQTSNLTSVLQTLNDFDATLAQSESIASTTMQIGSRKQIFIAMEKMKMQISDHLRSMGTKRKQLKASTISCIWSFNGAIDSLNKLTTLGDFEYTVKEFDFVAQFEKHYNIIKEMNLNKIGIFLFVLPSEL